tara:strand:- start:39 stop:524 length:486 start_codon:yes stop_codon:yes gene_type:complete
MNRADKINATANWVNKWRLDNGFILPDGTPNPNITPSKDLVPFRWMHPFLNQVKLEGLKLAQMNADGTYRYDHDPQSELWRRSGEQGPIKIDPKLQKRIDSLKSTFPWNQANAAGDKMIQDLPRGGYYRNSHRDALKSGDLTKDKLIETLKIAAPLLLEKA